MKTLKRFLRRRVPRRLLRLYRYRILPWDILRRWRLLGAVIWLRRCPSYQRRKGMSALRQSWCNEGWSASIDYLMKISEYMAQRPRHVVECGSGLTTVLLALLARPGQQIVALEHDRYWYIVCKAWLLILGLDGRVSLHHADLKDSKSYDYSYRWYEIAPGMIPREIDFVICDGPPAEVQGSRYGLLPTLGDRLSDDAVILLDDVQRKEEVHVLRQWETTFDITKEEVNSADGRSFAVLCYHKSTR